MSRLLLNWQNSTYGLLSALLRMADSSGSASLVLFLVFGISRTSVKGAFRLWAGLSCNQLQGMKTGNFVSVLVQNPGDFLQVIAHPGA